MAVMADFALIYITQHMTPAVHTLTLEIVRISRGETLIAKMLFANGNTSDTICRHQHSELQTTLGK